MKHLAIFSGNLGEEILNGKKTIDSRFSKSKIPPFSVISSGDLVYIKPSGKDIIGQFRVQKVIFFDGLDVEVVREIRERYGDQIMADESYWKEKESSKYGTLIFIGQTTRFITSPITYSKKDLRGWVVLDD